MNINHLAALFYQEFLFRANTTLQCKFFRHSDGGGDNRLGTSVQIAFERVEKSASAPDSPAS